MSIGMFRHWFPAKIFQESDLAKKKPDRTKKKLETTAAFRPKRKSAPGGTVVRFGGNATEFRAKRIGEIKQIFAGTSRNFVMSAFSTPGRLCAVVMCGHQSRNTGKIHAHQLDFSYKSCRFSRKSHIFASGSANNTACEHGA